MADKKISQLTALAAASVAPSTDVMAVVDTNATETKKITVKDVVDGALNTQTANGVVYLNGSKEATAGSVVTYDGTTFKVDGAAVFNDSGADVDFRVEGDTDSNLLFVDASADNVGIGTNAPTRKLHISSSGTACAIRLDNTVSGRPFLLTYDDSQNLAFTNSSDSGYIAFVNGTGSGTERLRLDSAGNLGLGVTPSAWDTGNSIRALQLNAGSLWSFSTSAYILGQNAFSNSSGIRTYVNNGYASEYEQASGQHIWKTAASGTAGDPITFTQAMTLEATGGLAIGRTSTGGNATDKVLAVEGTGSAQIALFYNNTNGAYLYSNSSNTVLSSVQNLPLVFNTNNTERARITSGGNFLVGSTGTFPASSGAYLNSNGVIEASVDGTSPLNLNRGVSDGTLVNFYQSSALEGNISVSGNTVSYNAFAGSHWSQLQDGSKPDILRGTVMESINELCEWPDETNERLPKCKISDTAGSKKVYGVFMAWDNDWTETNDMYVTAVGAFICRVNAGVTVQEGDLLESNGDGTARVQADDLIRSSTIGKVTSTVKTHEYDDGSYCVPTVLYCG